MANKILTFTLDFHKRDTDAWMYFERNMKPNLLENLLITIAGSANVTLEREKKLYIPVWCKLPQGWEETYFCVGEKNKKIKHFNREHL